ncbi:MAG: 4-alpha-glucanotransferase [Eubacteriaceae bacterium]|nr:4-alpha-glucanotransferase [Eubacteriaceae bacterium]
MSNRFSGILLSITSLPSDYGIGTLGKEAYHFIDFLHRANQKYWQILPVGPISYGDSPYQSFSTFAGNPYLVDLDMLIEKGLLEEDYVKSIDWGNDPEHVDYGKLYENRFDVLEKAYLRHKEDDSLLNAQDIKNFCNEKKWLDNYSLFMALKRYFGMRPWTEWPEEDIRKHQPEAIEKYRNILSDDIEFFKFIQYLFFSQWKALKDYAGEKGIKIIGDVPIYVALDSADVWASPECFLLDEENLPIEVSGVPPDAFSADGQLWGNPLYRWDYMKERGYGWWIDRIAGAFELYDILRIDHFRGFESYWAVPYGESAVNGHWVKGPDMDFVGVLSSWFAGHEFIAEDLGYITPEVAALLSNSGFPGMKVLQFAFDSREESNYLPHTYYNRCVCYTGTHDNTTLVNWTKDAAKEDVEFAKKYLGVKDEEELDIAIVRAGMSSVADTFIAQMQDYLRLDIEGRMNTPGVPHGNWRWRMKKDAITDELAEYIAEITKLYGRSCR